MNILNFQENDDDSPAGFSPQNHMDTINADEVIQIVCCISNINKYKKIVSYFPKPNVSHDRPLDSWLSYRLMMNGFYLYFLRLWKYKPAIFNKE